jgi:hypothetical protein
MPKTASNSLASYAKQDCPEAQGSGSPVPVLRQSGAAPRPSPRPNRSPRRGQNARCKPRPDGPLFQRVSRWSRPPRPFFRRRAEGGTAKDATAMLRSLQPPEIARCTSVALRCVNNRLWPKAAPIRRPCMGPVTGEHRPRMREPAVSLTWFTTRAGARSRQVFRT